MKTSEEEFLFLSDEWYAKYSVPLAIACYRFLKSERIDLAEKYHDDLIKYSHDPKKSSVIESLMLSREIDKSKESVILLIRKIDSVINVMIEEKESRESYSLAMSSCVNKEPFYLLLQIGKDLEEDIQIMEALITHRLPEKSNKYFFNYG